MLPIESDPVPRAPAPLSLRTDTVGIFVVLGISGISQLFTGPPDIITATLPPLVTAIWTWTLIVFSILGFVSTLVPGRYRVLGMFGEGVARLALGAGAMAYSLAILNYLGWSGAGFGILVFAGIALVMLVGAAQVARWLHRQRQVVTVVMHYQAGEAEERAHEHADAEHHDEHGGAQ